MYSNTIVIIPAYNPSIHLIEAVKDLLPDYEHIIVVNDGSNEESKKYFEELKKEIYAKQVIICEHKINMGKGKAIKTALQFSFDKFKNEIENKQIKFFITVDADGQHIKKDINNCINKIIGLENKNEFKNGILVLGAREFPKDIPFRSKFGNETTIKAMKFFHNLELKDTQTGLRAFDIKAATVFSNIKGDRYEYEINMLIKSKRHQMKIEEVPIQTIYINDNEESHFNPLIDSYKIYKIIIGEFFNKGEY